MACWCQSPLTVLIISTFSKHALTVAVILPLFALGRVRWHPDYHPKPESTSPSLRDPGYGEFSSSSRGDATIRQCIRLIHLDDETDYAAIQDSSPDISTKMHCNFSRIERRFRRRSFGGRQDMASSLSTSNECRVILGCSPSWFGVVHYPRAPYI